MCTAQHNLTALEEDEMLIPAMDLLVSVLSVPIMWSHIHPTDSIFVGVSVSAFVTERSL